MVLENTNLQGTGWEKGNCRCREGPAREGTPGNCGILGTKGGQELRKWSRVHMTEGQRPTPEKKTWW